MTRTDSGSGYQAGVCNIGPAEIARRRRIGHVGLISTILLYAVVVLLDAPPLTRFIVALPAAMSAAGYIQAAFRFCIAFGSAGVFNFGDHGSPQEVVDSSSRSRDRMRAIQLSATCAAVGVAVGIVAVLLPI